MENNLKVFQNSEFGKLEVFIDDKGKEWFPATDVAKILGYKNPQKAIKDHCKTDGVTIRSVVSVTTNQYGKSTRQEVEKKFINEGNLYRLIVKSKLPQAERFESWVFDEVLPTIRKTGGYVNNEDTFINTYLPFADEQTKLLFKGTLEVVRKQNEIIKQKDKEIEYKENVIIGLVDEIDLASKRQILNQVVRKGGKKFYERWNALYKQFELKYHMDLEARFKRYNENNKPKLKNKLDYIDKVLNKVPELYEIACKLYENDIKQLIEEMYGLQNK